MDFGGGVFMLIGALDSVERERERVWEYGGLPEDWAAWRYI